MKLIKTNGIQYLERFSHTPYWYWGCDYSCGDLYEAEDVYRAGNTFRPNRLILVEYPEGMIYEPIHAGEGQYIGANPVYLDGMIYFIRADFPKEIIEIFTFSTEIKHMDLLQTLPLSMVKDCYNLMLHTAPLMLTRQGNDDKLQIIWPETKELSIGNHESFLFRDGEKLYFSNWEEEDEPEYNYWEEVVVRDDRTGEEVDRFTGMLTIMPDGQRWLIK